MSITSQSDFVLLPFVRQHLDDRGPYFQGPCTRVTTYTTCAYCANVGVNVKKYGLAYSIVVSSTARAYQDAPTAPTASGLLQWRTRVEALHSISTYSAHIVNTFYGMQCRTSGSQVRVFVYSETPFSRSTRTHDRHRGTVLRRQSDMCCVATYESTVDDGFRKTRTVVSYTARQTIVCSLGCDKASSLVLQGNHLYTQVTL